MNVGLFTTARSSAPSIASTVAQVTTSGHSNDEVGAAAYAHAPAYDGSGNAAARQQYLADYPLSSFADQSGRLFRLADPSTRTPYMFGAVGDGTSDDSAALQAFFDDAFDGASAARCRYDFTGTFATSKPLYSVHGDDGHIRRFTCGRITVLPVSAQPGGVPMEDVLTIAAYKSEWQGRLRIDSPDYVYAQRRFHNGIRLKHVLGSRFESIMVDNARRDGVAFDPAIDPFTLRSGTRFAVSFTDSNNIGTRIEALYTRNCGSTSFGTSLVHTQAFTGNSHLGAANSFGQLGRLTVGSTSELRVGDLGKVRLEIGPSVYTTIAASHSAGTLTWATGNPVQAGLAVGDKIVLGSGANRTQQFEILGFSGSSSEIIAVYPKPEDEAAAAVTRLTTAYTIHQIRAIPDSTHIDVFPWVPARLATGTWVSMHGFAANVRGKNTANLSFGYIEAFRNGGGLNSSGMYGPHVDSILGEYTEATVVHGATAAAVAFGTVIEHIHSEVAEVDFLQITDSEAAHALLKGASSLYLERITKLEPLWNTAAPFPGGRALINVTIDRGGQPIVCGLLQAYSYGGAVNLLINEPRRRKQTLVADSGAIQLAFDDDVARLAGGNDWAELLWMSPAGAAPTGTLTFSLSAELAAKGWTIVGTNPISAPAKACRFDFRFNKGVKKVFVTRFEAV